MDRQPSEDAASAQHRESEDATALESAGSPSVDMAEALELRGTAKLAAEESLPLAASPIGAEEQIESSKQSDSAEILQENASFVAYFMKNFDELQSQGYEQNKNQILLGILEALKAIKQYEYQGKDPELAQQVVEQELKRRVLSNEVVFGRLKKLILLRERERSTRENSIKILKKLVKFDKQACVLLLALKVEVLISFILEREYKHAQVLKEREQSFKLILAWLEHDPATFPYLLGQTVATIARNPEDS